MSLGPEPLRPRVIPIRCPDCDRWMGELERGGRLVCRCGVEVEVVVRNKAERVMAPATVRNERTVDTRERRSMRPLFAEGATA